MKKILLLILLIIMSVLSYGQKNLTKVYLTNGETKQGEVKINDKRGSIGPIVLKSDKYMKEITIKTPGSKKEKIGIDQIKKIEFTNTNKKGTQITMYVPITISEELVLSREIVPNKLYKAKQTRTILTGNDVNPGQYEAYYIKKRNNYERISLSSIKKEYNCEGKAAEENIAKCLKGK